jgi:hypothetical protein
MHIHKYTSTKEIINNFMRNTAYNEYINFGDMAYWIYEAMELIGYPLQYIPKVIGVGKDESYELSSYRVELPCDFHKLMAISVNGAMASPASSSFHHLLDGDCCGFDSSSYPSEEFYDNFGNIFSPNSLPLNSRVPSVPVSFTLNNNYITFNVKEGNVCMAYWAFPLDEEGFPLIPDDVKYKRACSNYLQYRIDYIMWRQDLIADKVYAESKQEWEWGIASASSHIKMPDLNQMEMLRTMSTKMIVRTNEFKTAFSQLNVSGYRGRY